MEMLSANNAYRSIYNDEFDLKIKAMRKLRVIYSDPDATDCSSDEEEDESRRDKKSIGLKRVIHQIDLDESIPCESKRRRVKWTTLQKDEPIDSPCSVLESECSEDSGGLELKQSSHISNCEEFNSRLMELGSLIIDNNGFLLGEFSRLDDLWICDMKVTKHLIEYHSSEIHLEERLVGHHHGILLKSRKMSVQPVSHWLLLRRSSEHSVCPLYMDQSEFPAIVGKEVLAYSLAVELREYLDLSRLCGLCDHFPAATSLV
ncbi:unnamed protein product [Camellia sinensis]